MKKIISILCAAGWAMMGLADTLCSATSSQFSLQIIAEGGKVGSPIRIDYSPMGEDHAEVAVDGNKIIYSEVDGTYMWQPQSLGSHTLTHTAGTNVLSVTFSVTNLDYFVQAEPNPPMSKVSTLAITPTTRSMAQTGGGNAILTSGSGDWTAAVSDDWITLNATSGSAGTPVAYVVGANTNIEDRVGYVYVAGYTHTITQTGLGGSISPSNSEFERDGGTGTIEVTAQNRMLWQARSNCDWISVSPTSGTGEDTVTYQVAPWYEVSTRQGTLTVAGNTFTVFQYGRRMKLAESHNECDYYNHVIPITVNALAITTWEVTPNNSWISVVDAGNGKGGDTVTIAVAENPSYKERVGTVTIGTETYTVTQEGRTDLAFSVSPTTTTASIDGANGLISVTATPDLPWTASSTANWLTIMSQFKSGAGNGNVVYTVSPQNTLYERTGTITLTPEVASGMRAKTHTVTQPAATSSLSFSGYEFEAAGEACSVEVTVSDIVEWSIVNSVDWITVSGATSRVGPGTVTLSAAANETIYPRSGTLTIAGKTFSVSQKARGVEVEYDNKLFATDGGSSSVSIHPDGNVSWTAVASDSWIVIFQNDSGTGDAEILYIVAPYVGTGTARTGTITVGDQVIYITQRAYDLSISPTGEWVTGNNGEGEFGVSASIGDVWNAIVTEPWVTIVDGYDEGSGSGTVRFVYTENTTGKTRTAKIIVAGEVYTLTQAARTMVAITTEAGNGGTITGGGSYDLGSSIQLTATADSGYEFAYWILPDETESMVNPLTVTVDVAKEYSATFTALKPEITNIESSTEGVSLNWSNLAWATSYKVYRGSTNVPSAAELIVTITNNGVTNYQDVTGAVGQTYWYWIEAVGANDDTWSEPMSGLKEVPIVYSGITYTNLKGATNTNPDTYQEGTSVTFVNPGAVTGYTFAGWTPSQITSTMTGPQAIYANWTANTYTISYNANGGSGTMAGTVATYDQNATLSANTFAYNGYEFKGWATTADGAVVYNDGATVLNLSALQNGVVTLYAVWEATTPSGPTYEPPEWTPVTQEDTMILYARVYDKAAGEYLEADGSKLVAFAADGECRGVTEIMQGPTCKLYQLSIGVSSATETGFTLKLWNSATGETIELNETVDSNVDKQIGGIVTPKEFVIGQIEQTISLASGWNWISAYVVPETNTVASVFKGVTFGDGDVIKSASGNITYYGGNWYPSTFAIEGCKAYMVKKSSGGSEDVTIEGDEFDGAITVNSGWNWFGVSEESTTVSKLVHSSGFANSDTVKSSSGSATYYGGIWYASTFVLSSGVGYKAKLTNAGELTVNTAQAASLMSAPMAMAAPLLATSVAPEWTPVTQEDTMIVYARVKDSNGNYFEADGSKLVAFAADGECRGVTEIMQGPFSKLYQLSIGVASATESGFTLKLWDAESGEVIDVEGTLDSNSEKQIALLWEPTELIANLPAGETTPEAPSADASWWKNLGFTGNLMVHDDSSTNVASAVDIAGAVSQDGSLTWDGGSLVATNWYLVSERVAVIGGKYENGGNTYSSELILNKCGDSYWRTLLPSTDGKWYDGVIALDGSSSGGTTNVVFVAATNVVISCIQDIEANTTQRIVTEIEGGEIPMPQGWTPEYYANFSSRFDGDITKAMTMKTGKKDVLGNDMYVWQDMVAGTDPLDENSKFTATIVVEDGKAIVKYSPELSDAETAKRAYKTYGKASLTDASWIDITDKSDTERAAYQFFKVSVEMK